MTDEKSIIPALVKEEKHYSNIMDFAKNLTCEPVIKTNCKLCNSVHRKEAEDLYADGKSPHFIWKFLKTKNEEVSSNAVHNHFSKHYQKPIQELRIKEYAENLEEYSKIRMNEEERLNIYSSVLDQQIHSLGSAINSNNIDDMRKSQDTLIKLIDQAVKVQERIRSMRQENEPIKILVQRLNNVISVKWTEAKSVETKQVISEIVDLIVKETEVISNVNK